MDKHLLQFEILHNSDKLVQCDYAIVLLLCLDGSLTIDTDGEKIILEPNDIRLIEPQITYALEGQAGLFVRYSIDTGKFQQIFPHRYRFQCDSTKGPNDNYAILRRYLTNLLLLRYEGGEYEQAETQKTVYELLLFLVSNFTLTGLVPNASEKIDAVTNYISANFQEEISLNSISERFHMTPPSFSRFFKKEMGVTFYQYLSKIRLEYAVDDLLHTNKNLLRIALDSGFPNTSSFNRCFAEAFGVSPKTWRANHMMAHKEHQSQQQAALSLAITHLDPSQLHPDSSQCLALTVDTAHSRAYNPFWSEVVNLGDVERMNDYDARQMVQHLQESMHFHFARLLLNYRGFSEIENYSFFLEEKKLDDLVRQNMGMWFVLDFRMIANTPHYLQYLQGFISHFSNRYSVNTVRKWRFELVYNTLFDDEKAAAYWKLYQEITQILQFFQINEVLLGPGVTLGNWQGLQKLYDYMERKNISLTIQTLTAEPYTCVVTENGVSFNRATDGSYLKNLLLGLRQNSRFFRQNIEQVYITSWTETLLRTDLMNDSCYRGATIIKNIIDCFGTVGILAHGIPFDIAYTENLQGAVLFGGDGLISKHGLHKPSFYAYQFMQRVGAYYLTHDAHSIVFSNGEENYQIICHNRKRLSHRYYLEEGHLTWAHMSDYFDDLEPLELSYRLTNLKNGTYIVKSRSISQNYGSVQDEFHRMAADENPYIHSNDLDYLRKFAIPQVRLRRYVVTEGTLTLPVTLSANEFMHLHIIYQY